MILATFTWGSGYVANKFQLFSVSPYSAAFVRTMLSAIVFFMIYLLTKKVKNDFEVLKNDIKLFLSVIVFGVFAFGLFFVFFFIGLQYIEAGFATVVSAVALPISQLILGMIIFKERLERKQILLFVLALFGVSLVSYEIFFDLMANKMIILGILFIFIAQFLYAIYSVNSKNITKRISIIGILTYGHVASSVFLLFPFIYYSGTKELIEAPTSFWLVTTYVVIVTTFLGLYFNQKAISLLPIKIVSVLYVLTPIWGLTLSFVFLQERIVFLQLVGVVLVLFSVIFFNKK